MKTFDERLAAYFAENELTEDMQQAIKRCLGHPNSTSTEIIADVDQETQSYNYDVNFESILNMFENVSHDVNCFNQLCGYYGTYTLFVTEELEGIAVEQL